MLDQSTLTVPATVVASAPLGDTVLAIVHIAYRAYVLPPRARSKRAWMDQHYLGDIEIPCAHPDEAPVAVIVGEKNHRGCLHSFTYRVHRGRWYTGEETPTTLESVLSTWRSGNGLGELPGYSERYETGENRTAMIDAGLTAWAKKSLIIDGEVWTACDEPYWFFNHEEGFSWGRREIICAHQQLSLNVHRSSKERIECYRLDELDLAVTAAEERQRDEPITRRIDRDEFEPVALSFPQKVTVARPDLLGRMPWRHHAAIQRTIGLLATARDLAKALDTTDAELSHLLQVLPPEESAMGLSGTLLRSFHASLRDLQSRLPLRRSTPTSEEESP